MRNVTHDDDALRHNAFVYDTEDEYVEVAVRFLLDGLDAGQGGVVAHTRDGVGMMRDALGRASDAVTFVDVSGAYTRPAKTLASYHQVYAEGLTRFRSLRAVADVQFGDDPREWGLWTGYEAVFNRSFAHLPVWVLCSYDAAAIPEEVLDGVWRTHPEVVTGGRWRDSSAYDLRAVPFTDGDPSGLVQVQPIDADGDLELLRDRLVRSLLAQGLPEPKLLDTMLASTELLANAFAYGRGVKALRTGRVGDRYACEVVDNGPGFTDPFVGYLAPHPGRGAGLWLARQLAWDLEFFFSADGFTARITA